MAYTTATIRQIDPPDLANGRIKVVIGFTGNAGEPEITQDYFIDGSLSAAQLQAQVAGKAAQLNTVKTVRSALSIGQNISIVPPTPPSPTAAEVAKNNYFDLLSKYEIVKQDIENGLIASDDPKVTQLKADLTAAYKPEYSGI